MKNIEDKIEKFFPLLWLIFIGSIFFVGIKIGAKEKHKARAVKENEASILALQEENFKTNPPAEYKQLEETVKQLRGKLQQKCERYDEAFDMLQITNSSRFASMIAHITEMENAIDEYQENLEAIFFDAQIHFETNDFIMGKIDKLEECLYNYSSKSLHKLKKAYCILDRHRTHWKAKGDWFDFDNLTIELELANILEDVEFPERQKGVKE